MDSNRYGNPHSLRSDWYQYLHQDGQFKRTNIIDESQPAKLCNLHHFKLLIKKFQKSDIIAFTDGSAYGNPGPAGAGMILAIPNKISHSKHIILRDYEALGKGTNNIGELYAIWLIMKNIINNIATIMDPLSVHQRITVQLLTDSEYVHGIFTKKNKVTKNMELIGWIK